MGSCRSLNFCPSLGVRFANDPYFMTGVLFSTLVRLLIRVCSTWGVADDLERQGNRLQMDSAREESEWRKCILRSRGLMKRNLRDDEIE